MAISRSGLIKRETTVVIYFHAAISYD
jgi:hypothetical protein